jgi:hypothetical protein
MSIREPDVAIDRYWLNNFNDSHLHRPVLLLLEKIQEALDKTSLSDAHQTIKDALELRSSLNDPLEQAEATVMCALFCLKIDHKLRAINLLVDARKLYGESQHHATVVLWMIGAIYSKDKKTWNKAYQKWCECIESYNDLASRCMKCDDARFYRDLVDEIQKDL